MFNDLPGIRSGLPGSDDAPRAAVLIPLYADAGVLRMILTKRPMHMPTHAGDLAFPGGKPQLGETPVETALREAEEEVGLLPATVDILGHLPEIHTVSYTRMVVPVVGRLTTVPELRPDPGEVEKILLPEVNQFRVRERWRVEFWDDRPVHFFPLDGEVLWGATARMVRQLVGLDEL